MADVPSDRDGTTLTLVVHGTFAAEQSWWRLGEGAGASFADRLEAALAERGLAGSVWRPALAQGLGYGDFAWSGLNSHRERCRGAAKLAQSLNGLAERLGCSREQPLTVNLVGHSHGGNVVLEALRHLAESVRIGRIVFLGTPLICFRPAFRPGRIAAATFGVWVAALLLFSVVLMAVAVGGACLLSPFVEGVGCNVTQFLDPQTADDEAMIDYLVPLLAFTFVFYGWFFLALAWAGDLVWYWASLPILMLRGRRHGQAYGPPDDILARRLGGKKLVLMTSQHDEAELLLQLGAAPNLLYRDYVGRWPRPVRWLEWLALRPYVDGLFLKVAEIAIERYAFGFPWLRVLCLDHEMVDLESGKAYPSSHFTRLRVSDAELDAGRKAARLAAAAQIAEAAPPPVAPKLRSEMPSLYETLNAVARDLAAQLKLRHSLYYESEAVIEKIADALREPVSPAAASARSRP